MKGMKENPPKIDEIDKVVDRWSFCLFKLGFSESIYKPSFNWEKPDLNKQKNHLSSFPGKFCLSMEMLSNVFASITDCDYKPL